MVKKGIEVRHSDGLIVRCEADAVGDEAMKKVEDGEWHEWNRISGQKLNRLQTNN